ncbi:hypothetical protein PGT21_000362 [Puccinia graminis f. sp. tritici]|uniref:Uncharacterized protein n=1 Tax=Puccinia graminis f. sp. tritici TaxID=56615 RepID=A0A5B0P1S1_PUCGR|nr:hypothetical protein PGT21_000362 [Puccinia graminis f. sp. tritici]
MHLSPPTQSKPTRGRRFTALMIRTDHNSPYTNDEFTKAGLESAIDKLLGLAVMCYYNLDHYMLRTNNTNSEHPLAEDHSIVIAGHYIISKIRAIKTSSDTPANYNHCQQ